VRTVSYEPHRNVITQVKNQVGSTVVSQYNYRVNRIGQRTTRSQSGSAFSAASQDSFGYNNRGELTTALNDTDTTLNFAYAYDAIGNRISATELATSASPEVTSYDVNALNQYDEIDPDGSPLYNPGHDLDGKLTNDGKGNQLTWDGEHRLIDWHPAAPVAGDKRVGNAYDCQSRRIRRQVYEWTTATGWVLQTDEAYLYDEWNPVAKYTVLPSSLSLHTSYTWGLDVSGTMQGAGGVGGLLGTDDGTVEARFFYDANGNVSEVLNAAGNTVAHYEYDPFGNVTSSSGIFADANPYRFSTKPVDDVIGYYYYGYRFYDPVTGRWISKDPIGERGGENLYQLAFNEPLNRIDILGLAVCCDENSNWVDPVTDDFGDECCPDEIETITIKSPNADQQLEMINNMRKEWQNSFDQEMRSNKWKDWTSISVSVGAGVGSIGMLGRSMAVTRTASSPTVVGYGVSNGNGIAPFGSAEASRIVAESRNAAALSNVVAGTLTAGEIAAQTEASNTILPWLDPASAAAAGHRDLANSLSKDFHSTIKQMLNNLRVQREKCENQ